MEPLIGSPGRKPMRAVLPEGDACDRPRSPGTHAPPRPGPQGLTSIGFLMLNAGPCPAFLPFPTVLFLLGFLFREHRGCLFLRCRHGFRPDLSSQDTHRKGSHLKQHGKELQPSAHHTAQTTRGKLTYGRLRRCRAICWAGNDAPGSCCWNCSSSLASAWHPRLMHQS
jgi:hypothetical protein